jgi:hypothetical protein
MLPLADGNATLADPTDAPLVVHATWALARTPDMDVTMDMTDDVARVNGARTGVLQASADGVGVSARIGCRPCGEVTEYEPRWSA